MKRPFLFKIKPKNVIQANVEIFRLDRGARYIFSMSGLIGIFPFRLIRGHTSLHVPFAMASIIINSYVAWKGVEHVVRMLELDSFKGSVPSMMEKFILISVSTIMKGMFLFVTMSSFSRARYIDAISEEFGHIDSLMKEVCPMNRRRNIKKRYFLGGILIFLYSLYRGTRIQVYEFLVYGCKWMIASQFSVLADLICSRIRELSDCLKHIHMMCTYDFRELSHVVVLLSEIQGKLCDVSSVLQDAYKNILTVQVTACFVQMIISLFYIYVNVIIEDIFSVSCVWPFQDETRPMPQIIEFLFTIYIIWVVTTDSIEISDEIENFNVILYRLMIHDKTKTLLENKRLATHIAVRREVKFSACGLFNFDYKLIHSILAAATTYFVTLISLD